MFNRSTYFKLILQQKKKKKIGIELAKAFSATASSKSSPSSSSPTTMSGNSELPLKPIPGSYGVPIFGAIKDRLDFFWFQGEQEFWTSRMKKYNSTIFRVNVPPSPPGFSANKVIMLLDQKSFPVLFDNTKVDKRDNLLVNYMPSLSYYGGIRPCIYLDPSEERHTKIKGFIIHLIMKNASKWIPEMQQAVGEAIPQWEEEMKKKSKAQVNSQTSQIVFNVLTRTLLGTDPLADGPHSLKKNGPSYTQTWLGPQLLPIASAGLPHLLEELLLHTFPIPAFLTSTFYDKLIKFFETYGSEVIDLAESEFGIDRHDALHNIIFFMGFNAFGGLNLFIPYLISYVGSAGPKLHEALVLEVRENVASIGGGKLTPAVVKNMELLRSVVYESLRMSPPVPYQYGRAKEDMIIETHEGRYEVKKGEMLGGCQPIATKDPKVFTDPETFIPDRFVGEDGKKLLKYVIWSNGPGDEHSRVDNKQCPAADLVPFLSQTLLACLFLQYDSFTTLKPTVRGNNFTVDFSSLNRAT